MLGILELGRESRFKERSPERGQRLVSLRVDSIRPNPHQPRREFEEESIEELAQSIARFGLLQPVSVRRLGDDCYELIAGERRLRAARRLGLEHINAIVSNCLDQESAFLAMLENLQRENLHFFEEAEGLLALLKDHGLTQEELATQMGKKQSTIANKLRLLRLSRRVREEVLAGNLTERHARALLRVADEQRQIDIAKLAAGGLSVKQTEELVEAAILAIRNENTPGRVGVVRLYRDYRIFLNTIKSAVKQMKSAGLSANYSTIENNNFIEVKVIIPKV